MGATKPRDLIDFWTAAGVKAWFGAEPVYDTALRERFETAHMSASRGELDEDPVVYAITDKRSLLLGVLVVAIVLFAL